MGLMSHQVKFAKDYTGPNLICHEGGTGKTVCACVWLRDGRDDDALVVCPRKVMKKWKASLKTWGTKATVIATDELKTLPLKHWSAKVIDEADEFASPLFVAKLRSDRSVSLYNLTQAYPDIPTLLLTATPVRSNPWNLHSLLTFAGKYIDWKEWRRKYFYLQYPDYGEFRYLTRPAYLPKPNWREMTKEELIEHTDIVLLRDCVDELPPITEEMVEIKTPKFTLEDGVVPTFFDYHRHEQQNKYKEILENGRNYRKVLVVAYYIEQIEDLQNKLSRDRETFVLCGKTKNQEDVIEQATKSDECFFIVQASIGSGFDADTFSCIDFASMSYAVRDFVQMKFRVRRIHNLHPVKYRFLIGGRCDRAVLENVQKGKDFVPSEWR